MYKWQSEYLQRLKKLSNDDLLEEYTDFGGGDGYDGGYTENGYWKYNEVKNELKERLTKIGFLQNPPTDTQS